VSNPTRKVILDGLSGAVMAQTQRQGPRVSWREERIVSVVPRPSDLPARRPCDVSTQTAPGRLKRAGWSVGHAAFGAASQGDGTNGENVLLASAATLEEAYRLACVQARAVGMLAPAREGWRRG
jgi:hypothetical protein